MSIHIKEWERIKQIQIKDFVKAQEEHCKTVGVPMFIPDDDICWNCKKDITLMLTIKEAISSIITNCPFCSISFCE